MTAAFEAAVADIGMPDHWSWRVEVRSRRTLGLDVLPDGSIVIAVPRAADPGEVARTVRSRRLWLANALQRRAALAAEHPAKEIVDGEGFAYLGRNYRLLLVDGEGEGVKLRGGWLRLYRPVDEQTGASAVVDWYTAQGQRWLTGRVRGWAGRIGVPVPRVSVLELGTRWGRRNRDGSVTFHWAVMQLQSDLVDLVVVHELVHLVAPHHDSEFRTRLLLALPDAERLEACLAGNGRQVWIGAVRAARRD
jgi:hypothetical protein